MRLVGLAVVLVACGGDPSARIETTRPDPITVAVKLPSAPGEHGPSLVKLTSTGSRDVSDGEMLADADSCGSCHPDAQAQWSTSAHSFASFGNPIYRFNVEVVRKELGKQNSKHCGGCHDMPLLVDGLMTQGDVPPADLRSHTGVSCRLCHGIAATTKDGNGSYVWSRTPIDAPVLGDTGSIAVHKKQVRVPLDNMGTELCVGCHRGFISNDMAMPVHLSGLDEPGMWRNSAYTGNGMARIDKVEKQTCIDCHMSREPASDKELGAKSEGSGPGPDKMNGKRSMASHRFLGGHTWMAGMRGDEDHLKRSQAKLQGVASIDVAGVRIGAVDPAWHLPADGAAMAPGSKVAFDVVIRNLLVGHRFPGGVLDIQDTWIEIEVTDKQGKRLVGSGLTHETDPDDEDTHVLRTLVVDEKGDVLEEHEMAKFRTQVQTQTLAAREAHVIRYAFAVPEGLTVAQQPLTVAAKLRHRSRTLKLQAAVCRESKTAVGKAFIEGAKGARSVEIDPCKAQPITLISSTAIEVGQGAAISTKRPAWEREYEHGMALTGTVTERLEEARAVLEKALADAPDPKAKAMVKAQLGWVASKQGRVDDALALVQDARSLLAASVPAGKPVPNPPVLDAIAADALARVWRWDEAVAPAKACTERAPKNAGAWVVYARVLGSVGDNAGALAAATTGLEFAPRDQDLLRSQATALAALGRPEAKDALAAFDRFRSPDQSADLRIACAGGSIRCARDRELGHTIVLKPVTKSLARR